MAKWVYDFGDGKAGTRIAQSCERCCELRVFLTVAVFVVMPNVRQPKKNRTKHSKSLHVVSLSRQMAGQK